MEGEFRDVDGGRGSGEIAEECGGSKLAIVGGAGRGGVNLPGEVEGLEGVVRRARAVVHMHAEDIDGGSRQEEVEGPEGGAEGVGEVVASAGGEGVCFAECVEGCGFVGALEAGLLCGVFLERSA